MRANILRVKDKPLKGNPKLSGRLNITEPSTLFPPNLTCSLYLWMMLWQGPWMLTTILGTHTLRVPTSLPRCIFYPLCLSSTNSTLINHIHKINFSSVCSGPWEVGRRQDSLLNGISFMPGPDYKEEDVHLRRMESGFGFRILGGDEPGQPVSWIHVLSTHDCIVHKYQGEHHSG